MDQDTKNKKFREYERFKRKHLANHPEMTSDDVHRWETQELRKRGLLDRP